MCGILIINLTPKFWDVRHGFVFGHTREEDLFQDLDGCIKRLLRFIDAMEQHKDFVAQCSPGERSI